MKEAPPRPARWFLILDGLLLAAGAGFFWLWYERYFSIDFNEAGRYYDPVRQIVYTDSAFVWCLPGLVCLIWGLTRVVRRARRGRGRSPDPEGKLRA